MLGALHEDSIPPCDELHLGCRLSCCDGQGLRISTVNFVDEPCSEELAQPSFAFELRPGGVLHPPQFKLRSTSAPTVYASLWPRYDTTAARVFSWVHNFCRGMVRTKQSYVVQQHDGRGDGVPPRYSLSELVLIPPVLWGTLWENPENDFFWYSCYCLWLKKQTLIGLYYRAPGKTMGLRPNDDVCPVWDTTGRCRGFVLWVNARCVLS